MKIKAYAVGNRGCEHNMVYDHYFSKKKALKRFHEIRMEMLKEAKGLHNYQKKEARKALRENKMPFSGRPLDDNMKEHFKRIAKNGDEMYRRIIKNLKETNPDKLDNYPHDEPFLEKIYIKL